MDKQSRPEFEYTSSRYFREMLLPNIVCADTYIINEDTPYSSKDELEYIFVRSGSVIVNGEAHRLSRGAVAQFFVFEFHRFAPDEGETLVIDYFRATPGSYHVLFSCPSFQPPPLRSAYSFVSRFFAQEQIPFIEALMGRMRQCFVNGTPRGDNLAEYIYMEFMGYWLRLF